MVDLVNHLVLCLQALIISIFSCTLYLSYMYVELPNGDVFLKMLSLYCLMNLLFDYYYFKAFSKVVQKLVPQLPTLENLLNILITVSIILVEVGLVKKSFLLSLLKSFNL